MVKVKVCGLTNLEDISLCQKAGADLLGFVTEYPVPVPWNLPRQTARNLIKKGKGQTLTVVVTSGPLPHILEVAHFTRPDFLQLHGLEDLNAIKKLVQELKKKDIRIIKALSLKDGQACFEIPDPLKAARILDKTGIFAIVLDNRTEAMPGGTGSVLNWELAAKIREEVSLPLILAGGLNSSNVEKAIRMVKPYGVDVLSGVESRSARKDIEKVTAFVKAVRKAEKDVT